MTATAKNLPASRMTLANVRTGKLDMPMRVLLYGVEGVGKSTFGAGAPAPIFLGADSGTSKLDIARLPEPSSWDDVLDGVRLLEREKHGYRTLVVDPVNWLEPLCWEKVTGGAKSIEDVGGGFGKGYNAALDHWRVLVAALERVWTVRRMNVVLIAHSLVRRFDDPSGPAYDRYEIAMNAKASGLLKQWVDYVLFTRHEAVARKEPGAQKAKGIATGERLLYTEWSAAYDAKTRDPIPAELPLSWEAFAGAISQVAADVRKAIDVLLETADDELKKRVTTAVAGAKDDAQKLRSIEVHLRKQLETKKGEVT